VPCSTGQLKKIERIRKKMREQDLQELHGDSRDITDDEISNNSGNSLPVKIFLMATCSVLLCNILDIWV
jgi:hypothetical protein